MEINCGLSKYILERDAILGDGVKPSLPYKSHIARSGRLKSPGEECGNSITANYKSSSR